MDDACIVGNFQRLSDLAGDVQRFTDLDAAGASDPISERFSLHQFHHDEAHPVGLLQPVNRGDVGVVQRGKELRFAL